MNPLARILDANRLTGANYVDWYRNLKIVLNSEKIGYVLNESFPKPSSFEWQNDDLKAKSYILASMSNELQKQHENMKDTASIILHLRELYGQQSRNIRYEISKELFRTKMSEGTNVNEHVVRMINLIEQLESLDFNMDSSLQIDLILQSLPNSFSQFIVNFHMNKIECTLAELNNMLYVAQTKMKGKFNDTALVVASSSRKKKHNKKKTFTSKPCGKINKKSSQGKLIAGKINCFHCKKDGHSKRNCSDLKSKIKGNETKDMSVSCILENYVSKEKINKKSSQGKSIAGKINCFHCKKDGHSKRNCSDLKSLKVNGNETEDKRTCFHCKKDGHCRKNCSDYLKSLKVNGNETQSKRNLINGEATNVTWVLQLVGWVPPETGWVKVNTDGCSKGNPGSAGGGAVLRDDTGRWLDSLMVSIGWCDSATSELWAAFHGLNLAWDYGCRKVILEVDSRPVMDWLQQNQNMDAGSEYKNLVLACKTMIDRDWTVQISHTLREGNRVADWLANEALRYPRGVYKLAILPSGLLQVINIDMWGGVWPRVVRLNGTC